MSTNWNKDSVGGVGRIKILNMPNKNGSGHVLYATSTTAGEVILISAMTASNGCILHAVISVPTNIADNGYAQNASNTSCKRLWI